MTNTSYDKVIKKHKDFNDHIYTEYCNWFTYTKGQKQYNQTNFLNFLRETKLFLGDVVITSMIEFHNYIDKSVIPSYLDWMDKKTKELSLASYSQEDVRNWIKGAIGEYFFLRMFEELRTIVVSDYTDQNKQLEHIYNFQYVSPKTASSPEDLGMDMTGVANDIPIALQIKFWNPFVSVQDLKKSLYSPKELVQALYSEAHCHNYVYDETDTTKNLFICCLHDETEFMDWWNRRQNKDIQRHIEVIGRRSLEATIVRKSFYTMDVLRHLQSIADVYFDKVE